MSGNLYGIGLLNYYTLNALQHLSFIEATKYLLKL